LDRFGRIEESYKGILVTVMDIKTKKFGGFISESQWKRRWRKPRVYTLMENREKSWKLKSYGKVREISKKQVFGFFFWKLQYSILPTGLSRFGRIKESYNGFLVTVTDIKTKRSGGFNSDTMWKRRWRKPRVCSAESFDPNIL
jgi:hypothetical protein